MVLCCASFRGLGILLLHHRRATCRVQSYLRACSISAYTDSIQEALQSHAPAARYSRALPSVDIGTNVGAHGCVRPLSVSIK